MSIELFLGFCLISLVNNVEIIKPAAHLAPAIGEIVNNITEVNDLLQDLLKNYEKSNTLKKVVNNGEIKELAVHLDPGLVVIINNITKVNSLLQDLIKNVEKLKKMSKPESIFDTYEDTVIHDDDHEKKSKKSSKPTSVAALNFRIRGTAMEVSDEKKYNTASTEPKRWERNRYTKKEETKHRSQKDRTGEETIWEKENHREVNSKQSTSSTGELSAHLKQIAKKWFTGQLDESQETTVRSQTWATTKGTEKTIDSDIEPRHRYRTGLAFKNNGQKERQPIYIQKSSEPFNHVASTPTFDKKLEPAIQLSDIDSIEESKIIQNEEHRTNMLREAYGNACLKLVVRKCYMACKSVFKQVCRTTHKCSSHFKQSFKKHAITGCDSSFYNNSIETSGKRLNQDKNYVDLPYMTREGYLSMACGPISSSQAIHPPVPVRRKTGNKKPRHVEVVVSGILYRQKPDLRSRPEKTSAEIKSLKAILRSDKYELACQQASMMKCFNACKYAAAQACKEEKCNEKKKSALDKACKSHCKQSYGGRDSDDESDSDDSGSESEEEKKEPEHEW